MQSAIKIVFAQIIQQYSKSYLELCRGKENKLTAFVVGKVRFFGIANWFGSNFVDAVVADDSIVVVVP